jgi:hypothetical protein
MEVYNSRVYKVCKMDDRIEGMNETYWQMRAEVVPEEQQRPLQDGERDIQVCHFSQVRGRGVLWRTFFFGVCVLIRLLVSVHTQDKEFPATHPSTFGDPLLIRIRDDEPVGEIKHRIQVRPGRVGLAAAISLLRLKPLMLLALPPSFPPGQVGCVR